MKFIKGYKIFESDGMFAHPDIRSVESKIKAIFDKGDFNCTVHVDHVLDSNYVPIIIVRLKISTGEYYFRAIELKDEMVELQKMSSYFRCASHSTTNKIIHHNNLNELVKDRTIIDGIAIKFYYEDSNLCSNPECDNVLESDVEKCPVCGETK